MKIMIILLIMVFAVFLFVFFGGFEKQNGIALKVDSHKTLSYEVISNIEPLKDKNGMELYFGFDARTTPEEDARQFLPFLQYLSQATGYNFKLHFTPKSGNIINELGNNKVDFAVVASGTYFLINEKYKDCAQILVQGLDTEGKPEYRASIIVPVDSAIKEIKDIRGKRFAFGSITSTQGHIIPRVVLEENGIKNNDLSYFEFIQSHRDCAGAIVYGLFDAGAIATPMADDLQKNGLVRIIYTSKFYPSSGIIVNKKLAPEIIENVKKALLDFQPTGRDREGLYNWEKTKMATGFSEAKEETFNKLRSLYIKYGVIKEIKGELTQ